MTDAEVRAVVAEAFRYANVHGVWNDALCRRFLAGEGDVALDQLELDSLAAMEVCIGIEVNSGVELVPDQLRKIATLRQLVDLVRARA